MAFCPNPHAVPIRVGHQVYHIAVFGALHLKRALVAYGNFDIIHASF